MDGAVEKSAMRKIYMRLLPFAILSYDSRPARSSGVISYSRCPAM
jgi:hypothetical protein